MRLHSNQQRPFVEIRHVAVAIAVVQPGQQHTGILHKEEVLGEVRLAHLAWHNQLKAGCVAADQLPCPFDVAEPLSQEVLKQLQLHGKSLGDS